ncbi:efflux RND transporter periplasmic adaptor subunit [Parasalinivibrio latis]|uniref:efflux RND transporter periplasmic adaptor subunit n=1 Tax=Parasalinivibrio latis TaxID=2952610 RepID=UPI0030DF71ED
MSSATSARPHTRHSNATISVPVLLGLFMLMLSGCDTEAQSQIEQVNQLTVSSIRLTPESGYPVKQRFLGTVKAPQESTLGFELAGKLSALHVAQGDTVTKGQKIASLNTELLETELNQLMAKRDQIAAQLQLIKRNLSRQLSLKKKGFSADAQIDDLKSQRNTLSASLDEVDAGILATRLRIDKSTVYAPYNGVISARHVSQGDVIGAGTPTFTLLSTMGREAHIGVPAEMVNTLESGATFSVEINGRFYEASLINPAAALQNNGRTVNLRFELPKDYALLPGELAYLTVNRQINKPGYWIPMSALTDGVRGTWNIFSLTSQESDNHSFRVERRLVNLLYATESQAFIAAELGKNPLIVSEGLHRIVAGAQVTTTSAELVEGPQS